jgi:hypothetical protein
MKRIRKARKVNPPTLRRGREAAAFRDLGATGDSAMRISGLAQKRAYGTPRLAEGKTWIATLLPPSAPYFASAWHS